MPILLFPQCGIFTRLVGESYAVKASKKILWAIYPLPTVTTEETEQNMGRLFHTHSLNNFIAQIGKSVCNCLHFSISVRNPKNSPRPIVKRGVTRTGDPRRGHERLIFYRPKYLTIFMFACPF